MPLLFKPVKYSQTSFQSQKESGKLIAIEGEICYLSANVDRINPDKSGPLYTTPYMSMNHLKEVHFEQKTAETTP
jgi:hypothetical protein